jgi:hypothetical protein
MATTAIGMAKERSEEQPTDTGSQHMGGQRRRGSSEDVELKYPKMKRRKQLERRLNKEQNV